MTRREFDAGTKENWHGAGMASDEWRTYRRRRGYPEGMRRAYPSTGTRPADYVRPVDYVTYRAEHHAYVCHILEPMAVLCRGSRFRAPQAYRASAGASMLRLG